MNYDELKDVVANSSDSHEGYKYIMYAIDKHIQSLNAAKLNVGGSLPLTESQIIELANIGSTYVYEGVMEGRISAGGIFEVIRKYEEFKRQ